jgi:hypothetical protein
MPLSVIDFPAAATYTDPGWRIPGVISAAWLSGLQARVLPSIPAADTDALQAVYLDVLVGYLNDILCMMFTTSWDAEVITFNLAHMSTSTFGARQPIRPGVAVNRRALVTALPYAPMLEATAVRSTFVVPPGTSVTGWSVTREASVAGRVLEMSNPFATVRVMIDLHGWAVGAGGVAPLVGMSYYGSQEHAISMNYVMRLEASFERLRSGHPEMAAYMRWVDTFFAFASKLDSQERWQRIQQEFAFLKDQQIAFQREHQQSGTERTEQAAFSPPPAESASSPSPSSPSRTPSPPVKP